MLVGGILLIAIGAVYLFWPMLFRRGIWLRTSIAVRMFSEENYKRYMRVVGALTIIFGAALIVWDVTHRA